MTDSCVYFDLTMSATINALVAPVWHQTPGKPLVGGHDEGMKGIFD